MSQVFPFHQKQFRRNFRIRFRYGRWSSEHEHIRINSGTQLLLNDLHYVSEPRRFFGSDCVMIDFCSVRSDE